MKAVLRWSGWTSVSLALVLLGLWVNAQRGTGKLTWRLEVKKSVHTFAYKVYADPFLDEGRFFLSKIVFQNTGSKPVGEFSISYQVPGYIEPTTPETLAAIPAGQTIVKLFYPKFPKQVARMRERTRATLEIKIAWKEGGKAREDLLREDFLLRGINELEWSDIPVEDRSTWQDGQANAALLAAMVTPNDPVVAEYAGQIVQYLKGAVAGAGGAQDKFEFLEGTYNYMIETGLHYAGANADSEKLGEVSTTVQTIRLPRDQILHNDGLCVELAVLWASLAKQVGIDPLLVMIPGHAFVRVPSITFLGKPFTIECTAITPKAVGASSYITFSNAITMAQQEYAENKQKGTLTEIDVSALQVAGIVPAELPDVDIDRLKTTLSERAKPKVVAQESAEIAQVKPGAFSPPTEDLAARPARTNEPPQNENAEKAGPTGPSVPEAGLTAFQLIKEGNRYVGEDCRDHVVQIRSERSWGAITPGVWYIVYYDPDAAFHATEVKFSGGQKISTSRPMRMFEPIGGHDKPFDAAKLKVDSDRALATALGDPSLSPFTAKNAQFWLERRDDEPVWRIRLWVSKLSRPSETAEIGDVYVSTEEGKIVRSRLHLNSAQ